MISTMTDTTKRYKLLKDYNTFNLEAKKGDIGVLNKEESTVWFDNYRYFFSLSTCTTQPEWFEEVLPEPVKVRVDCLSHHDNLNISTNNDDVACLSLNDVFECSSWYAGNGVNQQNKFFKADLIKKANQKLKSLNP